MSLDGTLNTLHVGVGRVADMVLDAAAEEVGVLSAVSTGGAHDDHALDHAVFEAAPAAPDGALQVVVILDAPFAGFFPCIEECLDLLEEFRIDQRFMPAVVGLGMLKLWLTLGLL